MEWSREELGRRLGDLYLEMLAPTVPDITKFRFAAEVLRSAQGESVSGQWNQRLTSAALMLGQVEADYDERLLASMGIVTVLWDSRTEVLTEAAHGVLDLGMALKQDSLLDAHRACQRIERAITDGAARATNICREFGSQVTLAA